MKDIKPIIKISPSTYQKYKSDFDEGKDEVTIVTDESMDDSDIILYAKVADMLGEPSKNKTAENVSHKIPCSSNKSDRKRNRKDRWR